MQRGLQGYYLPVSTTGEPFKAFIPKDLPPDPPIKWTTELRKKFDKALVALGRLDGISDILPNTPLFIYSYIRQEAVLSSMIEGTQSSFSDLMLYEIDQVPGVPLEDVQEVSNYVNALQYGLKRLEEYPLCLKVFREIHAQLLSKGRGSDKHPGEFRSSQNWIGGTRPGNASFVPPPHEYVMECIGKLELFLHDEPNATATLLKAALAHVQFETIHPFLDGNGRLGRLLIILLLCEKKIIKKPILYLSLYFKQHRQQYYQLLNDVRENGDWEAWLDFFADSILFTAEHAINTIHKLSNLIDEDQKLMRKKIQGSLTSALEIHKALTQRPLATSNVLSSISGKKPQIVNNALKKLIDIGIVEEITGQKRNRIFCYAKYIDILNVSTEDKIKT